VTTLRIRQEAAGKKKHRIRLTLRRPGQADTDMTTPTQCPSCAESLAASVGFGLLGERPGAIVEQAVNAALRAAR
jgi:hypothetical protein